MPLVSRVEPVAESECRRRTTRRRLRTFSSSSTTDPACRRTPSRRSTATGGRSSGSPRNSSPMRATATNSPSSSATRRPITSRATSPRPSGLPWAARSLARCSQSALGLEQSAGQAVTDIGATVGSRRFSKSFELEADAPRHHHHRPGGLRPADRRAGSSSGCPTPATASSVPTRRTPTASAPSNGSRPGFEGRFDPDQSQASCGDPSLRCERRLAMHDTTTNSPPRAALPPRWPTPRASISRKRFFAPGSRPTRSPKVCCAAPAAPSPTSARRPFGTPNAWKAFRPTAAMPSFSEALKE